MKWFQGSIPAAIQEAHAKRVVFVVYIHGKDEISESMSALWEEEEIKSACDEAGFVGLRLEADSENCKHFSKIYPVVCVPCAFFIGENGVPLEVTSKVTSEEFLAKISKSLQLHATQLRGEPLGSPLTPGSAAARRTTPTEAQPVTVPAPPVVESPFSPASPVSATPTAPASSGDAASPPDPEAGTSSDATAMATISADEDETPDISEKLKKAQELRDRIQQDKLKKEADKEKEEEQKRRDMGKEVTKLKQWQAEQEAKELREQMKKDRDDERAARRRVKEQIAKDREERAARYRKEKEEREEQQFAKQQEKEAAAKQDEDRRQAASLETARLQFRLPDGSAITQQFASQETLGFARLFLKEKIEGAYGSFTLSCNYPKRDFSEEDMSKSLLDLELAPSAALIVLPGSRSVVSSGGGGGGGESLIWMLLAPLVAIWNFFYNLLFGAPAQPQGAYNPDQSRQTRASNDEVNEALERTRQARQNRPKSSYGVRVRQDGNIRRLTAENDDEDMSTYNGNSTQQM